MVDFHISGGCYNVIFLIFMTSQNTYYISAKGSFFFFFFLYRLTAWENIRTGVYLNHFESEKSYVYPRYCGHDPCDMNTYRNQHKLEIEG